MDIVRLASILAELLRGHGVAAEVVNDVVHVPALGRWANLWMAPSSSGGRVMEVRATTPGRTTLTDTLRRFLPQT